MCDVTAQTPVYPLPMFVMETMTAKIMKMNSTVQACASIVCEEEMSKHYWNQSKRPLPQGHFGLMNQLIEGVEMIKVVLGLDLR